MLVFARTIFKDGIDKAGIRLYPTGRDQLTQGD